MVTAGAAGQLLGRTCEMIDMGDEFVAYHVVGLQKWAGEVSSHLGAGWAEIDVQNNHAIGLGIPTSLVVGGWPSQQPCCAAGGAPDPLLHGIAPMTAAALEQWQCLECGDNRAPLVWASMPLVPFRDCPDAAVAWRLPAPAAAAAAADVGFGHWRDQRSAACGELAAATAGQLRALFEADPDDAVEQAQGLVEGAGLFVGPDESYPLGIHLEWGPVRAGGGVAQIGYHEPVPIAAQDNQGRRGGFEWQFEPVESISLTAAAATRLWQPEWVHAAARQVSAAAVADRWASSGWGTPPSWLTPSDSDALRAIEEDLQARARVMQGRGIEL